MHLLWCFTYDRNGTIPAIMCTLKLVVVVIVDQQGLPIGGMGKFEGLDDEFFAAGPRPAGVAQVIRSIIQRLIDDLPFLHGRLRPANRGSPTEHSPLPAGMG